jgi:ADP-ribose pyrophosphatase YjhB (NUDIX family)
VIFVEPAAPVAGLPPAVPAPFGVVLVKRRYEPLAGQWSLPGGMLELGETLAAGVAREVREETGLVVEVGEVVDVLDRMDADGAHVLRHHYVLIDYLCRATGGTLEAGSDAAGVVLADPAALAPFNVSPVLDRVVNRAMAMMR